MDDTEPGSETTTVEEPLCESLDQCVEASSPERADLEASPHPGAELCLPEEDDARAVKAEEFQPPDSTEDPRDSQMPFPGAQLNLSAGCVSTAPPHPVIP